MDSQVGSEKEKRKVKREIKWRHCPWAKTTGAKGISEAWEPILMWKLWGLEMSEGFHTVSQHMMSEGSEQAELWQSLALVLCMRMSCTVRKCIHMSAGGKFMGFEKKNPDWKFPPMKRIQFFSISWPTILRPYWDHIDHLHIQHRQHFPNAYQTFLDWTPSNK